MSFFNVGDKVFVFPLGIKGIIVDVASYEGETYDEEEGCIPYIQYDYLVKYDTAQRERLNITWTDGWWEECNLGKGGKRQSGFGDFVKSLERQDV